MFIILFIKFVYFYLLLILKKLNFKLLKKEILICVIIILSIVSGCSKNSCKQCSYDGQNGQLVNLGVYCGDSLRTIKQNGYMDTSGLIIQVECK